MMQELIVKTLRKYKQTDRESSESLKTDKIVIWFIRSSAGRIYPKFEKIW